MEALYQINIGILISINNYLKVKLIITFLFNRVHVFVSEIRWVLNLPNNILLECITVYIHYFYTLTRSLC